MSGYSFPNVFQIFNLNKGIIATAISQATFGRHAMNHRGSECEDSDPHALQCDPATAHSSRLSFSATGSSNPFFVCIFPEKQELKKPRNQSSQQSCNRIDIEIEIR